MEFITNVPNPNAPGAKERHFYSHAALRDQKLKAQEWAQHLNFVAQHEINRPQPTEKFTSEYLQCIGMVGLYKKDNEARPISKVNTLGVFTSTTRPHFVQIEVSKNDLLKFAEISGEPVQMFAWDVPHVSVTAKDDITLFFFTNEIFNDDEKNIIQIV